MNQAIKDAAEVLNRPATQFDRDRRFNNQNATPFWYPFIPKPYLGTDYLNAGLGLLGITIRPGETKTINIQMGNDSVYRLINVKFTPYRVAVGSQVDAGNTISTAVGSAIVTGVGTTFTTTVVKGQPYAWTDDAGVVRWGRVLSITDNTHFVLEEAALSVATAKSIFKALFVTTYSTSGTPVPVNLFHQRPLTQMLRATYILTSLRGRYLLGGSQWYKHSPDTAQSGTQERPLLISALQGVDSGLCQLRTESLVSYLGVFSIKVTNIYTESIILNGTLFGYKIVLGG